MATDCFSAAHGVLSTSSECSHAPTLTVRDGRVDRLVASDCRQSCSVGSSTVLWCRGDARLRRRASCELGVQEDSESSRGRVIHLQSTRSAGHCSSITRPTDYRSSERGPFQVELAHEMPSRSGTNRGPLMWSANTLVDRRSWTTGGNWVVGTSRRFTDSSLDVSRVMRRNITRSGTNPRFVCRPTT